MGKAYIALMREQERLEKTEMQEKPQVAVKKAPSNKGKKPVYLTDALYPTEKGARGKT